jgi:hypothetical protein
VATTAEMRHGHRLTRLADHSLQDPLRAVVDVVLVVAFFVVSVFTEDRKFIPDMVRKSLRGSADGETQQLTPGTAAALRATSDTTKGSSTIGAAESERVMPAQGDLWS